MAPNDYVQARKDAETTTGEEESSSFCRVIDGLPYFPKLVVPVVGASECERNEAICKVVQNILERAIPNNDVSWTTRSSWTVAPITGGNTNQLFAVSGLVDDSTEAIPSGVLVRLFGAEGMIDRDFEMATYDSLANQELALPWYGRFGNGRVEGLLIGYKTLTEDDLVKGYPSTTPTSGIAISSLPPDNLNQEIARKLARLHSTYRIPLHLQTEPDGSSPAQPTLWTQLYPWLERALEAKFRTDHDTHRASVELNPSLQELLPEVDWIKNNVIGENNAEGIGYCHNDLLASNIMMLLSDNNDKDDNDRPDLKELHFVDFEYGGINYYAYDIANHFNEYAGGTAEEDNATPNYDRCPTEDQKRIFLGAYVKEFNLQHNNNNDKNNTSIITVEELEAQVDGFSLANHLVWGLWGVLQAATEGCEEGLDYLHYAKCRFDRYRHDKELLLKTQHTASPSTR